MQIQTLRYVTRLDLADEVARYLALPHGDGLAKMIHLAFDCEEGFKFYSLEVVWDVIKDYLGYKGITDVAALEEHLIQVVGDADIDVGE